MEDKTLLASWPDWEQVKFLPHSQLTPHFQKEQQVLPSVPQCFSTSQTQLQAQLPHRAHSCDDTVLLKINAFQVSSAALNNPSALPRVSPWAAPSLQESSAQPGLGGGDLEQVNQHCQTPGAPLNLRGDHPSGLWPWPWVNPQCVCRTPTWTGIFCCEFKFTAHVWTAL